MRWFRKLYVWSMNVKLFMAFYFLLILFALAVVEWISGGDSLKLLTLVEMLLACTVIGLIQEALLNDSVDYSKGVFFGRSIAWLILSTGATVGIGLLFGWFAAYPPWSLPAFIAFLLLSFTMTLLGLKFEQEADTVHLNERLRKFKEKQ